MWYTTKLLCSLFLLCFLFSACDAVDSRDSGDVPPNQALLPSQITAAYRIDQQEVLGPCPSIWRPDFLVPGEQQYLVSAVSDPRSILVFNTETGAIEKRSILPDGASLLASFNSADKLVLFYSDQGSHGLVAMNSSGETVLDIVLPNFGGDLVEVIQRDQGEYLLLFAQSGFSGSAGERNHLVALTESGQVIWSRPVLHSLDTAYPTAVDVVLREDRSVVVAGYSNYLYS